MDSGCVPPGAQLEHQSLGKTMDEKSRFRELMSNICKRRHMYVCGGTFYEVCAYISGYAQASKDCPLGGEGWSAFSRFVAARFGWPDKYGWPYVIKMCSADDASAAEQLQALVADFCDKLDTSSYEEVICEAARENAREEGEPEKVLRRLLSALLRGRRQEIEPLILDHPDAVVLWEGEFSTDAAEQLDDVYGAFPIGRLPETGSEGKVHLMSAHFPFPLMVKQIEGQWKVDVTEIVDMRKHARDCRTQQSSPTDAD